MKPISLPEKSFLNTSTVTPHTQYDDEDSPQMKKSRQRNNHYQDGSIDDVDHDTMADDFQSERSSRNMNLTLEQQQELLNLSKVIRFEESARMKYEDERRKLLLSVKGNLPTRQQQTSLRAPMSYRSKSSMVSTSTLNHYQYNDDNNMFDHIGNDNNNYNFAIDQGDDGDDNDLRSYTIPSIDSPSKRGHADHKAASFIQRNGRGKIPSPAELETAYKWLNLPRTLVLLDRVPKSYVFRVVMLNLHDPQLSMGYDYESKVESSRQGITTKSYSLEWLREETSQQQQQAADGCVLLEHIKQVSISDIAREEFIINVICSTKALKNSNGRTTITIRCDSIGACAKYVSSLNTLLKSYQ